MGRGELMHNLLQGITGVMRNTMGDEAQDCLVYFMATTIRSSRMTSGESDLPGCSVVLGWDLEKHPEKAGLTKSSGNMWSYVVWRFEQAFGIKLLQPAHSFCFAAHKLRMSWASPATTLSRYVNDLDVKLELQKHRLYIVKGKGQTPAMILREPEWPEG